MEWDNDKIYVDNETLPYWKGLNKKELNIQQCNDCYDYIFYPRTYCPNCFSDNLVWKKSNGKGTIYSYTVVHRAFGQYSKETPFVIGLVDLEEKGIRMMTRIIGDNAEISIGKSVMVEFVYSEKAGVNLPYFKIIN